MQLYEGLPITTNKISLPERKGVPHHLIGCITLAEEPWTIHQFHERANRAIEEIRSRGKLPIVVGGTHYYTQSLLVPKSLVKREDEASHESVEDLEKKWPILGRSVEEQLEELRKVDPAMANRWHPKDGRKIRRSLHLWLSTGTRASEVYDGQNKAPMTPGAIEALNDEAATTRPLNPLVFWTHSTHDALVKRLEERVDAMMSHGLFEEVQSMSNFRLEQKTKGISIDDSRGIWTAIGYKEMLPYVSNQADTPSKEHAIDLVKIATRQYAKRQARWIRLALRPAILKAGLSERFFLLDATDAPEVFSNVEQIAVEIADSFLKGDTIPEPNSLSSTAQELLGAEGKEIMSARYCKDCDKTLMTESTWTKHLNSKKHKKAATPKTVFSASQELKNQHICNK